MWQEDQPVNDIYNVLKQHVLQLKELSDQIKAAPHYGYLHLSDKTDKGNLTFPYWEESEQVALFRGMAYNIPLLVEYDWVSWGEGRQILQKKTGIPPDMDILEMCKLITIMIRADRFNEGFLVQQFENGNVLQVLGSLVNEVERNN